MESILQGTQKGNQGWPFLLEESNLEEKWTITSTLKFGIYQWN
ncbi:MAG: hypothetical protein KIPDCIKN_00141 [Haliscomenobacter sp.]|jgi:hypothetical protein|nr:hypothetical protein [Haliscomenobacter sp.]